MRNLRFFLYGVLTVMFNHNLGPVFLGFRDMIVGRRQTTDCFALGVLVVGHLMTKLLVIVSQ